MNIFGKAGAAREKKNAFEQSKEWVRELKREERKMERQIKKIDRELAKMKKELKVEAKKASKDSVYTAGVRAMAKAIVKTNGHKARMWNAKAQINSASLQIKQQQANMRMAATMKA